MKKLISVLIGLFLVMPILAQGTSPVEIEEKYIEPAYISYLEGNVDLNFEKAEINMILMTADELKTENGRIEVKIDQVYLRLDKHTAMVFVVLEEGIKTIRIKHGNVYLQIKNGEIAIQTPHKQDILSTGSHLIEVEEKTKIYSNPRVPFDSFLSWNFKRNDELNRRSRTRYLPEELNDYEYALYNYGSWRYDPIYDYVWIPHVSDTWRPYFYGRWVWYPIIGWTWISYEPYGWCTYHYGRWQWDSLFGWYWIPTRIWGPSWVYFHSYGDYYFWTPRWYDDHYYQRHRDRYTNISSNAWTTIHKDQLKSRNISRSVISKSELTKVPRISQNQLRTSLSSSNVATTTNITLRKIYPSARKIYSPDSGISIRRKNVASPSKSYSPRTSTLRNSFRTSRRISSRSFLSPKSRSFLRPSSMSRSSLLRTVQKIRKK